jgi:hypothetical protein
MVRRRVCGVSNHEARTAATRGLILRDARKCALLGDEGIEPVVIT